MKLFGRRVSPSVAFVGGLALLFVVVAPLRAATRLGEDSPTPEQKQLSDHAATAPAPRRPVPTPATGGAAADRGTGTRDTSARGNAADGRDPLQILDDALARKRRSDAQSDRDSTDRRGTGWDPLGSGDTARTSGRDADAPQRLGRAFGDLLDLLGGDHR